MGTVGSGKTSLANAIIGELIMLSGSVKRKGTIAYIPQTVSKIIYLRLGY